MRKYTPKDALPLPPALAGKGLFMRLLVPDDGDKRKAAIYGVALEAAANALEWLRHRLVNGLEGGTYDGPLSFTNLQTIGSHNPEIHVTSGINVDSGVHVGGALDVGGNVHMSGKLDVGGNVHMSGKLDVDGNVSGSSAFFQGGNFQNIAVSQATTTRDLLFSGLLGSMDGIIIDKTLKTRTGKTARQGAHAYESYRRVTADVSQSNTVDPTTFDMLVIPGPGVTAGVGITLAAPPGGATINPFWIVRRCVGAHPNTVTIRTNLGNSLARFPAGNNTVGLIQVIFDGTEYIAFPAIVGIDGSGGVTAGNVRIP